MGYILPVDNFQYQQYHNRVTKTERDPFPIEELYPIQFNMDYESEKLKEKTGQKYESPEVFGKQSSSYISSSSIKNEKIYAQVTGKGREFVAEA
ncbi:hypothetical protein F9U64_01425 [Gracilibacillus oryzae]|uniref:Uncharacterized protein n=1 Tax=Gracilibacillus oryzae TaxID=1672701 RepID=A0A7C8GWQ6_9BACI|nr:hypothetical protein [Gracilibacillus oryzae]KAB8139085.1 hypothetical protein F9U64_01425 [Gracilibacillus oryzae]